MHMYVCMYVRTYVRMYVCIACILHLVHPDTETIDNYSSTCQHDSNHTVWCLHVWIVPSESGGHVNHQQSLCLSQGAAVANNLASMRVSKSSWQSPLRSTHWIHPLRIRPKTLSFPMFSLWLLLWRCQLSAFKDLIFLSHGVWDVWLLLRDSFLYLTSSCLMLEDSTFSV